MAKKTDLAYAAGIIDGEGCISLRRHTHKISRRRYTYQLRVTVANTKEWLVNWLQFNFGGRTQIHHPQNRPNQKTCYQWTINARQAYNFLKLILPYLHLKRPNAELAIAFQEGMQPHGKRLTEEQLAVREAQRLIMAGYNKRGKS